MNIYKKIQKKNDYTKGSQPEEFIQDEVKFCKMKVITTIQKVSIWQRKSVDMKAAAFGIGGTGIQNWPVL